METEAIIIQLSLTGLGRVFALCFPSSQTQEPSELMETNPDKFLTDITNNSL